MNQKDFFNTMAEKWDDICIHDSNKINMILDILDIHNGANILDVGTGTGILLPFLLPRIGSSGTITAVDFSEKMLEVAKRKCPDHRVSFILGDIMEMPLKQSYYDYVICYSVFPHFEDKQHVITLLSVCLRNGGKLMICHSQSRQAINDLHKDASEAVARDVLPNVETINRYYDHAGISPLQSIDNDKMFVVIGKK